MVAAPMVATALIPWRPKRRLRLLSAAGLGVLTLLAILKATNEPAISNRGWLSPTCHPSSFMTSRLADRARSRYHQVP